MEKYMRYGMAVFSLAILSSYSVAQAAPSTQDVPRWYGALSGHVSFLSDMTLKNGSTGNLKYDTGIGATASLGYMPEMFDTPSSDVRIELEGGYHLYRVSSSVINAVPATSQGHFRYQTAMANAYYDMKTGTAFTPYIGGGAGVALTSLSDSTAGTSENQQETRFAWQLMTGVAYTPSWFPHADVALGYRYFNAGTPTYQIDGNQTKVDDISAHNAEMSVRYHF